MVTLQIAIIRVVWLRWLGYGADTTSHGTYFLFNLFH